MIFVNGYWGFPTKACCGGSVEHWGSGWVADAKKQIGDNHARFYDGSSDWTGKVGGSSRATQTIDPSNRFNYGFRQGKKDAAEIVSSLARDDSGNITESVKFVTSSMGAAYARGMSKAITNYIKEQNKAIDTYNSSLEKDASGNYANPELVRKHLNVVIEFTVDLDPFQGGTTGSDPNSNANYYMLNDGAESNFVGSKVPGAKQIGLDKNGKTRMHGHHPSWAPTDALPQSTMNGGKNVNIENKTN